MKMKGIMKYNHMYHQSLVYKMLLATVNGKVHLNPEQVLHIVREVNRITGGLKQIVYLAGWQFDGHDTGYPAWSETNPLLKCGGDATANESLVGLMRKALEFNAIVSVHINMSDAYEHSPLWKTYQQEDLLVRNKDGTLFKGEVWDGGQSYLVSKKREWESGFAKKRIDELLAHLPLQKQGTVHIDAFEPRPNPYHGITVEEDADAMAKVVKYWISKGVDVTTEWFHPSLAGLTPMVWHLNTEEADRLKYPASFLCGGGSEWNFRRRKWTMDTYGANWIRQPGAGCLYERAWGEGLSHEFRETEVITDKFIDGFCLKLLPWYALNRLQILQHVHTSEGYEVHYSEDVVAQISDDGQSFTLKNGDRILVDGHDVCMPALWRENEIWVYSRDGMRKEWLLPEEWKHVTNLSCGDLRNSQKPRRQIHVEQGRFSLELSPCEAVVLVPS